MDEALYTIPKPTNEKILDYAPGKPERGELKAALKEMAAQEIEIPLIIGGQEIRTGTTDTCVMPHDHGHVLGRYHKAGSDELTMAVEAARTAGDEWRRLPWPERLSIFLRAAELLSGPWRARLNAATMLAQSKTVFQAEIDSACELIDFFRFNTYFASQIYSEQPESTVGIWDRLVWRPLEGFILAISPFNFTSIAGNLPSSPAMMGNTVLWKPASSAVYSGYWIMKLFMEAGLPPGVINFIPSPGRIVGELLVPHSDLAGIHFTGSTATLQTLFKTVGENIAGYRSYPRIVGESGGKDFIVAHPSAETDALVTGLVRGAFEYQGQKCSAVSRAYIPAGMWKTVKERLHATLSDIDMGNPMDFRNFMCAIIDEPAFDKIAEYIDYARGSDDAEILFGGGVDKAEGFFIEPTVVVTTDPHFKLMEEEIFGPVLTVYVYPDDAYDETLDVVNTTSPYALTGAVFAQDRYAVQLAQQKLRHAAGNFYINDKPTGAVVGMQPFGGSRASGTNDKAGSKINLLRWVTPLTIKETFVPPVHYTYPHMHEE